MSDLLERMEEAWLQLASHSFDSADAGIGANLCQEAIDEIRSLREQLVSKQPSRERVAETIGWYLACVVAGNNQPHMSGDPRNRVPPGKRRSFDDACLACAEAILSLSDEKRHD